MEYCNLELGVRDKGTILEYNLIFTWPKYSKLIFSNLFIRCCVHSASGGTTPAFERMCDGSGAYS